MGISNFASKIRSVIALGVIEPGILSLVLRLKRQQKTFLSYGKLLSLVKAYHMMHKRVNAPIQIAEFGVGRGGSAMLLGWLINKYGGALTLFDLFGRIPPPTDNDGQAAQQRYADILDAADGQDYYGNLEDLQRRIAAELEEVVDLQLITFVSGRYEDTLPGRAAGECFHLTHIDCDWYASTRTVLDFLRTRLVPEAILQFDDYGYWSGSKQAVDETNWLQGYDHTMVDDALVIDFSPAEKAENFKAKKAPRS